MPRDGKLTFKQRQKEFDKLFAKDVDTKIVESERPPTKPFERIAVMARKISSIEQEVIVLKYTPAEGKKLAKIQGKIEKLMDERSTIQSAAIRRQLTDIEMVLPEGITPKRKGGRGRPKGSKNKPKTEKPEEKK